MTRAWWIRQGCFFLAAQIVGYLVAVELRDRYPLDGCCFVVFCLISATDELRASLRRRAISSRRSRGS